MKSSLDFRDLSKIHFRNDNVQAPDTMWDEVLPGTTDRPTDNILESLFPVQFEKSEELKCLLQVDAQDTTFGDQKYDHCRLKLMVKRHLERRPAIGPPSNGKAKGKDKSNAKNNSEKGDCIRWTTQGQCLCGHSCAFKHEPKERQRNGTTSFTFSDRMSLH